jgi:myosin-crossreactive antigen
VIDTPEDRSRIVFSSGILIGLKDMIDRGGHACPNSTVGEILLWKNAQKNEMKKNTSDEINNTIPVFNPFITRFEWCPWFVDSR